MSDERERIDPSKDYPAAEAAALIGVNRAVILRAHATGRLAGFHKLVKGQWRLFVKGAALAEFDRDRKQWAPGWSTRK